MKQHAFMDSPLGKILLIADAGQLCRINFQDAVGALPLPADSRHDEASLHAAMQQLGEYFAGARQSFELRLAPVGSEFQRRVWSALCKIPYGETTSYGGLAKILGKPTASRAVGAANGRNPLPVVVPCHRVIGSSGALTGYYGGVHIKKFLLRLEGIAVA